MNKLSHGIHFALGFLLLLTSAWSPGPVPPASASAPVPAAQVPDLEAFQRVTPNAGWVLLDQRLHWTGDGGQHWRDLTPAAAAGDNIRAVTFTDTQHGWLVTTSSTLDPAYRLFRTADGGNTWQSTALDLFAPGDVSALASAVFLEFLDANTGWLVVKQATSSAFNLGTLFATTDGGDTWTRLSIPAGVPVTFTSATDGWLDLGPYEQTRYLTDDGGATWTPQAGAAPAEMPDDGLSEISMATADAGWARSAQGKCEGPACELVVQLMRTGDGRQTWAPVSLPNGQTALQRTFAAPARSAAAAGASDSTSSLTLTYTGHGFDSCYRPTLDQMQAWYSHSPYKVWNLYIGGSSRFTGCGVLTRSYVQSLAQQGWLFIPTWVGPQPPCSNRGRQMSWDTNIAYNEGIIEALLALDVAENLGLTLPNQAGTIIYYDVENYSAGDANDPCRLAAKSFISGWTATLRARGNLSGVYGGTCSSYMSDYATIANIPDAVWLARWVNPPVHDPNASVWNLPCVDNSLWNQGQRLRQYAGDHDETWGGTSINIDSDVLAGPVAAVPACLPGASQAAFFIDVNFGGLCMVKDIGNYATHESLGAFAEQISSLMLGPNVSVQLCEHQSFGGVCQTFTANDNDLTNDPIGNDRVSSLKVLVNTPVALTHHIRLPLIARGSLPNTIALPNGGFESGPANWTTLSARGTNVIEPSHVLATTSVAPHSGNWAVWMGGVHTETVILQQTVTVPIGAANLSYWHWIKSSETGCYYDVVSLWVNGSVVESYGLCASANTNGWVKQMIDLQAYAGSVVALRFQVTTDTNTLSSLFLDDLVFESGP